MNGLILIVVKRDAKMSIDNLIGNKIIDSADCNNLTRAFILLYNVANMRKEHL